MLHKCNLKLVASESSCQLSCHFQSSKQWIQRGILCKKKKSPEQLPKPQVKASSARSVQSRISVACGGTRTFAQSCTHMHTLGAHALCLHGDKFSSILLWKVPNPKVKTMQKETLEGSSIPVSIGWDVVRKCRWKMGLCFLGPLQQCRCEERSKLSLCQWGGTLSTLLSGSFPLFHCSSLCAFLWCEVGSSTRRHLASGLHLGQDRRSHGVEIQSLILKNPS